MSGLVHVLIGWISLQVAFGNSSEDADQSGALGTIAALPGGNVLLWVGGCVMAALMLWHVAEAWLGARWQHDPKERGKHIVKTAAKAVVFGALAFTALRFAAGGGTDSGEQTSQLTAGVMQNSAGRVLIGVVGLIVFSIGIQHIYKGATRGFEDELRGAAGKGVSKAVTVTGMVGYIAKGVALLGVGVLFAWAAIGADPDKATGLDGALKTMAGLPAGTILLSLVGVGLIMYGIFSVLRARYASM